MIVIFLAACLWVAAPAAANTENVVGILSSSSGYDQVVTSSTLRWIAASDGKVPEHAVEGATVRGNAENDDVEKPVWVCRASPDGMWVPGQLSDADESNSGKCVVSIHASVSSHPTFEILQNVEDGGKLTWAKWDKYNLPPNGVVAAGTESQKMFIARRKASNPTSTVSYHLGRLDRSSGLLGKIFVIEDGVEKEYEDGEVLVETEPVKYEMERVKFNRWRVRYQREPVVLGATVLRNDDIPEDDGLGGDISRVDTVIAYRHNQTVSWGHGHAMLTGFPVTVKLENGTEMEAFKWAIDTFTPAESTYQIENFLSPGRGVNVTLVGNWTETNSPYTATVTAIYKDGSKKSRKIIGSRREVGIRDVHPELGPVYYLHNNTHVPTTTTTTTSTTTTKATTTTVTTSRTTSTSTEEAKPIPASPMEELNSTTKKGDPADPTNKKENQSMLSDGPKTDTSTGTSGGIGIRGADPFWAIGLVVVLCLSRT